MAIEVLVPRLGWTMEEGVFVEWLKQDGETVLPGELVYRIEGDKALTEVESMDGGILRIPPDSPAPGSVVPVGALLAYLVQPGERAPFEAAAGATAGQKVTKTEDQGSGAAAVAQSVTPAIASAPAPIPEREPTISPRALRVARELGVDWAQIKGSGRTGRIVEADVRGAATAVLATTAAPATTVAAVAQPRGMGQGRRSCHSGAERRPSPDRRR